LLSRKSEEKKINIRKHSSFVSKEKKDPNTSAKTYLSNERIFHKYKKKKK